jgi:hypothetical protein
LFKFPKLLEDMVGSLRLPMALKLMAQKGSRATFHHKGLEPKYVPRERGQMIWAIIPTQKISRGTTFNKGGTQGGKPPMLETNKVVFWC